jgi:hypothetical protein
LICIGHFFPSIAPWAVSQQKLSSLTNLALAIDPNPHQIYIPCISKGRKAGTSAASFQLKVANLTIAPLWYYGASVYSNCGSSMKIFAGKKPADVARGSGCHCRHY